jgi:hypothetical protein
MDDRVKRRRSPMKIRGRHGCGRYVNHERDAETPETGRSLVAIHRQRYAVTPAAWVCLSVVLAIASPALSHGATDVTQTEQGQKAISDAVKQFQTLNLQRSSTDLQAFTQKTVDGRTVTVVVDRAGPLPTIDADGNVSLQQRFDGSDADVESTSLPEARSTSTAVVAEDVGVPFPKVSGWTHKSTSPFTLDDGIRFISDTIDFYYRDANIKGAACGGCDTCYRYWAMVRHGTAGPHIGHVLDFAWTGQSTDKARTLQQYGWAPSGSVPPTCTNVGTFGLSVGPASISVPLGDCHGTFLVDRPDASDPGSYELLYLAGSDSPYSVAMQSAQVVRILKGNTFNWTWAGGFGVF